MPDPATDPEKYSIDDMMEKLQARDATEDTGELVTRSDGSKAMRVRKRKRRSQQTGLTKKEAKNQRNQIIQIAGVAVALVLIGLAAGLGILYANSTPFRESLVEKLGTATGAKLEMKQFRMNPARANASQAIFTWPEGNPLRALKLSTIVAKIHPVSFLAKSFAGEEIVAERGILNLDAPVAGMPASDPTVGNGDSAVSFNRYSVPKLDVFFGSDPSPLNMLKETEASFFPGGIAGQAEIRLHKGLLMVPGWPQMELDRAYMNVRNSGIDIQSFRFIVPRQPNERVIDKGSISFSGTVQPRQADTKQTLKAEVEAFSLPYLLGKDLGNLFMGRVVTVDSPESNFLTLTPGSGDPALLEVTVANSFDSRIELKEFKFLSQLAFGMDDIWYQSPFFTETSMVLKRLGEFSEVTEINLVQRSRMAVQGELRNREAGQIAGELRIGLPETMIASSPNPKLRRMFGSEREGYRWLALEISGTSAVPMDNFKALYDALDDLDEAPEARKESAPDSFDTLIEGE